jgi:hypothetical protein
MEFTFREAGLSDVQFISEVILEAEKGASGVILLAKMFNLSNSALHEFLINMLEEEIDGCEFSLSSFIIAEHKGKPAAAMGGWLEGFYDEMPSSILNANLINYTFPKESISYFKSINEVLIDLRIERTMGTYQTEYAYVNPEYRGHQLMYQLFEEHFKRALKLNPNAEKVQSFPFRNNLSSIQVHLKVGYNLVKQFESKHPDILLFANDSVRLLMERNLLTFEKR